MMQASARVAVAAAAASSAASSAATTASAAGGWLAKRFSGGSKVPLTHTRTQTEFNLLSSRDLHTFHHALQSYLVMS